MCGLVLAQTSGDETQLTEDLRLLLVDLVQASAQLETDLTAARAALGDAGKGEP